MLEPFSNFARNLECVDKIVQVYTLELWGGAKNSKMRTLKSNIYSVGSTLYESFHIYLGSRSSIKIIVSTCSKLYVQITSSIKKNHERKGLQNRLNWLTMYLFYFMVFLLETEYDVEDHLTWIKLYILEIALG